MLYINQRLSRTDRKQADKLARSLKAALINRQAARPQDPARMQRAYSAVAGFDVYADVIPAEALS